MTLWLAFGVIALFWSGSFAAIKIVVGECPPVWGGALRVWVSVAVLALYLVFRKNKFSVDAATRRRLWVTGLFMQGIPFGLLFFGEQHIAPGLAGIINSSVPMWTALLGFSFFRRHDVFNGKKMTGLLLGMAGITAIFWPKLTSGGAQGETLGTLAVLGMAFSYGLGTQLNRAIFVKHPQIDLVGSLVQQQLAASVFLGVLAFSLEGLPPFAALATPPMWGSLLYLGACCTAIAFVLYFTLLRKWGAARASTVTYVVPPGSILIDFLMNHRLPSGPEFFGAAAILIGVFLIQG